MNERVEEVEAERDSDDQSDDWLCHGAALLKLPKGERVNAHQSQKCNAGRHERDIEHDRLLIGTLLTAEPRKLSIRNWVPGRKEFIKRLWKARASLTGDR
jgi:hypothetical protein